MSEFNNHTIDMRITVFGQEQTTNPTTICAHCYTPNDERNGFSTQKISLEDAYR